MVRRLFLFVVFVLAMSGFAATANTTQSEQLVSHAGVQAKIIHSELAAIEKQLEIMNSELVEQNKALPDFEKLVVYRNYLARESYEYYKNYLISRIRQRSLETGRDIKITKGADYENLTLDRGILDSPECQRQGDRVEPCPYPDGFEDVWVVFHESTDADGNVTDADVLFYEDNKSLNTMEMISILMENTKSEDNTTAEIGMDVFGSEFDYEQYSKFREAERAIADMWASMSKKEKKAFVKKLERDGIDEYEYYQMQMPESIGLRRARGEVFSVTAEK